MAYFIPRLATAPNYSEGTSNYCLRRQKEGKNRSKKTPTMEWFHSNRFAPGFISYHGWLRSHRAHIFPIRAAMPPQALLPSLATAACVAQPTSGTPLCRPPPTPGPDLGSSLGALPGEPTTRAQRWGGARGASQGSADAFSAQLYPTPPRRTQSSKHQEGTKPEPGAPGASGAQQGPPSSGMGTAAAPPMGSQRSAEDCQAGVGAGKGTVCGCAHLWGVWAQRGAETSGAEERNGVLLVTTVLL